MRQPLFATIAVGAIVIGTSAVFSSSAVAQTRNQFYCGISEGKPATIVRTAARGNIPLIIWNNEAFSVSGFPPKKRCEEVSARFQRFNDNGQLNFMRAGMFNGQKVLCVDRAKGSGNCSSAASVVLTLPQRSNANQILEQMLDTRNRASKQPLYLSGERQLVTYENGDANVNLNVLLNNEPPADNQPLW